MNFLWDDVFEFFKERRRAILFVGSVFLVILLPAVACLIRELVRIANANGVLAPVAPGFGILFVAWVSFVFRRIRPRRLERYEPSPLSRDELSKARAKLVTVKK